MGREPNITIVAYILLNVVHGVYIKSSGPTYSFIYRALSP